MPYTIYNGLKRPVAPGLGATTKGRALILRLPGGRLSAQRPGSSVTVSDEVYALNKDMLAPLLAQGVRVKQHPVAPAETPEVEAPPAAEEPAEEIPEEVPPPEPVAEPTTDTTDPEKEPAAEEEAPTPVVDKTIPGHKKGGRKARS